MKITPPLCVIFLGLTLGLAFGGNAAPAAAKPAHLADLWTASLSAEKSGDFDSALRQVAAWQAAGGDRFLASLRTGWLYYSKPDYRRAYASYAEAARLSPVALNPAYGLFATAQAMNSDEKIRAAAELILRLEPTNYKAQMALAAASFQAKDYRKALGLYRRVASNFPDDPDALSGFAWASFYLGEKSEALRAFDRILSLNADYAWAQRGRELCNDGR